MFSRLQRRRSNLQDLGRLSKSCPAVDSPAQDENDSDSKDTDSWGSSDSLSDALSESSEEVTPTITRAEKQLARQSLRRAKQREVEQKRNLEENKISMDDYLGKQAQFRLWLLEEQKKQIKDLPSPKRKTYFKMFVRLWNKRHLSDKFYELRLSRHLDDDTETPTVEERKSPVNPNRPKFSLVQNSPALDPSIFPHSVDLSSDSIAVGTPSPFSTFGKSTPSSSLTPFRFSADCGSVASRERVTRDKDMFRFGANKENATHVSMPVFMTTAEHLRTATISPRKKMVSTCQERSLDRMVVNWSPRGQPKLNPVNAPRCPSPLHRQVSQSAAKANTATATSGLKGDTLGLNGSSSGLKGDDSGLKEYASGLNAGNSVSPGSSQHYHKVKDCLGPDSPTYAELPFLDGTGDDGLYASMEGQKAGGCVSSVSSQNALVSQQGVAKFPAKQAGGRGHRRRSRSLDEAPVYAVPSRNSKERNWWGTPTVPEKESSVSPPPLPPKRFDPHVEGLGVPYFSPSTAERGVSNTNPDQHQASKKDEGIMEKEAVKKTGGLFKGRLPWFGKKLTSRRRSRSCEALSPLPHAEAVAPKSASHKVVDQFPLVELERSPTFSRRVLTQPHRLTNKKADATQTTKKFEMTEYTSSPLRRPDKQPGRVEKLKFELTEYSSSPMKLGPASSPSKHVAPAGGFVRGKSIRRRSRSVEQINFASDVRMDFLPSVNARQPLRSGREQLQQFSGELGSKLFSKEREACIQNPSLHVPSMQSPVDGQSGVDHQLDEQAGHCSTARCEVYEQVKSDTHNSLSSLVRKIQQLSTPDAGSPASRNQIAPMEVEEFQRSPKRIGQEVCTEGDAEMTDKPLESPFQLGSVTYPPSSAEDVLFVAAPVKQDASHEQQESSAMKEKEVMEYMTSDSMPAAESTSPPHKHTASMMEMTEGQSADESVTPKDSEALSLCGSIPNLSSSQETARCVPLPVNEGNPVDKGCEADHFYKVELKGQEAGKALEADRVHKVELKGQETGKALEADRVHKVKLKGQEAGKALKADHIHKFELKDQEAGKDLEADYVYKAEQKDQKADKALEADHIYKVELKGKGSEADLVHKVELNDQKAGKATETEHVSKHELKSKDTGKSLPQSAAFTPQMCEAPCHREVVRNPDTATEVAFSSSVPAPKQLSGVCQRLCPPTEGGRSAWSVSSSGRRPHRRRSRSVGEINLPGVFARSEDKPSLPGAFATFKATLNFTPLSFPLDSPAIAKSTDTISNSHEKPGEAMAVDTSVDNGNKDLPVSRPELSESLQLSSYGAETHSVSTPRCIQVFKASSVAAQLSGESGRSLSTFSHREAERYEELKTLSDNSHSQPLKITEKTQQQQAITPEHRHTEKPQAAQQNVPKQPTQITEKVKLQTVSVETVSKCFPRMAEKLQPSQTLFRAEPVHVTETLPPQQTAPKQPPPVMAKPALSQNPKNQQSSETVPGVTALQQKFGNSVKPARPYNRRRSRSVGDMSAFSDNSNAAVTEMNEGGGFANVRAFWDRLRGGGGAGGAKGAATLQRKPSTMRRLQQQLYGDKPETGERKDVGRRLDGETCLPSPGVISVSQGSEVVNPALSVVQGKTSSHQQENMEGQTVSDGNAAGGKSEMMDKNMPIKKSPYVTVRRQSSRKRITGSPCVINSEQNSPHSRDHHDHARQTVPLPDLTLTHTPEVVCDDSRMVKTAGKTDIVNDQKKQLTSAGVFDAEKTAAGCSAETVTGKYKSMTGAKQATFPSSGQKKKPAAPPKTLPKPTVRPATRNQAVRPEKDDQPQSAAVTTSQSPAYLAVHMPVVGRPRKRRSQEQEQTAVPEKVSGSDHKGPVTRSTHSSQRGTKGEDAVTPQGRDSPDADTRGGTIRKESPNRVKTAKRRSNEKTEGGGGSFPVKRCNSRKGENEASPSAASRQSSMKAKLDARPADVKPFSEKQSHDTPVGRMIVSGKDAQDTPGSNRVTSVKDYADSPVGKRIISVKDYADSPVGKRIINGKDSKPDHHSAVKRQSSGRTPSSRQATPRRGSGVRVQRRSSGGRGTPRTSQSWKSTKEGKNSQDFQSQNPTHSTSAANQSKEDENASSPVRRFNSAREGARTPITSVKRLSSLKDETQSSRAKRRSGGGSGRHTTPVLNVKRTSSGKGRRQSGRVTRTDSARRDRGAAGDRHGDTPSRTGSFRKPPQSPTFVRITRRLGVFEEPGGNDDDSMDESVADHMPVLTAAAAALKGHCHGDDDGHNPGNKTPALTRSDHRTRQALRTDHGASSFAQLLEQTLSNNSMRLVGPREGEGHTSLSTTPQQRPGKNPVDIHMETDIDAWTREASVGKEGRTTRQTDRKQEEKTHGLSTMV